MYRNFVLLYVCKGDGVFKHGDIAKVCSEESGRRRQCFCCQKGRTLVD